MRALSGGIYEVVLLDLGLPLVDGWQILEGLEPGRPPSVIVISARWGEEDRVRALDMGADDYLAKPFGTDELLTRIRALLRRVNQDAVLAPPSGKASPSAYRSSREPASGEPTVVEDGPGKSGRVRAEANGSDC